MISLCVVWHFEFFFAYELFPLGIVFFPVFLKCSLIYSFLEVKHWQRVYIGVKK